MQQTGSTSVAEADARLALARRIMAVAGHDLKQPLQLAIMSIELAAHSGNGALAERRLGVAQDALKRLNVELDDLARMSQVDDRLTPRIRPTALGPILRDLDSDWQGLAEAYGVSLAFDGPDIEVLTDRAMFKTILRNLIGNAVKYSERGGRVSVTARVAGSFVILDVADEGGGIAREKLERIFDAFDRGGRSDADGGLGLGLHIVRQTAELLAHPIAVRSIEGEGSVFSVALPLAAPAGRGYEAPARQ
ncbi:sensor histidine kinase [Hansschlegelia zhihuaiae]|uniref:histidine kinase n=1 Tax=Hansschlegelia zhihuaiae TaxID=405005 RepID=A0A4Q0MGK5_9HYPH|nr:HAMP domain-containing sensor histidine kinase [Hansschlegelia zhihuaiae]RXF72677.1 HAMP domain-containing histidine kinase [Hansschlegelia zhihuaiae]